MEAQDIVMTPHVVELRPPPFKPMFALADEENPMPNLRVLEIYLADGQGEGIWTGQPSIFLRLSGCTVGCKYCDTKFSWRTAGGVWMSKDEIAAELFLVGQGVNNVVLTGGEPLEHPLPLVNELMVYLVSLGFRITVETSGTVLPDRNEWGKWQLGQMRADGEAYSFPVLWSVAPKLPFAGSRFKTTPDTVLDWIMFAESTGSMLQFKWVCRNPEDVDLALSLMEPLTGVYQHVRPFSVFIQPVTDLEAGEDAEVTIDLLERTKVLQAHVARSPKAQFMAVKGIQCMVRPQLHAILWGQRRGV